MPDTFCQTPDGLLLITNGIDKPLRWDGITSEAELAGIVGPSVGPTVSGSGSGGITGDYTAYLRYLDRFGNVSNFSPIQDEVTLTAVSQVNYTGVEVPTDPKVVRKQILRNTAGQLDTFYVDVDTTAITQTSFTSFKEDDVLRTDGEAVPLFTDLGELYANSHDPPPDWKAVAIHHIGRAIYGVDAHYTDGAVKVTSGSTTVTGVCTEWTETFPGRLLWVNGGTKPYEIESVDFLASPQTLTLTEPYLGSTDLFALYAITPALSERRLIYFSETGQPESVPPINAIPIQENGDEITGLMPMGSFVWVLERRHMHRWTYLIDPAHDGAVFKGEDRGCINQKCWAIAEDRAYMLDEAGIHAFNGQSSEPISNAVAEWFRAPRSGDSGLRIRWSGASRFFCVHYPAQETIRWFVTMAAGYLPRHAITVNYRHQRWWIEEFRNPVGSGCLGDINGMGQVFMGLEARKIVGYWSNELDGVDASLNTVRGTVTSADMMSITDSAATFSSSAVGAPLAIVSGPGKGQTRLIISQSAGRLTVNQPWLEQPDTTSTYQIGGIGWKWNSGRFELVTSEPSARRSVKVKFQPLANAATFDLKMYEDFDTEAMEPARTEEEVDGIATEAGDPAWVCNLTKVNGRIDARMDGGEEGRAESSDLLAVQMNGVTNVDQVRIKQVIIEGAD